MSSATTHVIVNVHLLRYGSMVSNSNNTRYSVQYIVGKSAVEAAVKTEEAAAAVAVPDLSAVDLQQPSTSGINGYSIFTWGRVGITRFF